MVQCSINKDKRTREHGAYRPLYELRDIYIYVCVWILNSSVSVRLGLRVIRMILSMSEGDLGVCFETLQ